MCMSKIPEGVYLINKEGKQIKELENYNDAYICIVNKENDPGECHVGKYANSKMPTYLPSENGVYCLKEDEDFGWFDWFDITEPIRVMKTYGLVSFI